MSKQTIEQNFVDLEIRIFPRQEDAYPIEITLGGQQEFRGHMPADVFPWVSSGDPVEDGRELFEALFEDKTLRSAWAEARGRSPQRRVRLRLDADAPELHTLPWELLHEAGTMLAAQADTPFSRYLAVSEPWGGAVDERPIRVLTVISSPEDIEEMYNLTALDADAEQAILEKAFFALDEDEIQLDFLDLPVTLERIEEALQGGAHTGMPGYHILHYVGHGAFNKRRQQAALYLQDELGDTEVVRDTAFIKMLARQSAGARPRLVFLAACQSAARSTANAFLGLGPKLVAAGVPAVVAMQDFVAVKTAQKLSLAFYRRLAEHGMVDCAMNEARSTLLTAGRPDAAVPALFMRLKSGQLWEREPEAEAPPVTVGPQILPPPAPMPPPEVADFVGREAELQTFADKLEASNLVVITGMPGVGKTALASVLAQRARPPLSLPGREPALSLSKGVGGEGESKTFWHVFHANEGIEEIIWRLAGFLYWHDQKDLWEMLQQTRLAGGQLPPTRNLLDYLIQMLRQKDYLLCLDNWQFLSEEDAGLFVPFVQRLIKEDTLFVIASQVVPAFVSLAEVNALAGLSAEDTHRLLIGRGLSLSPELEAEVYARTEGNPQLLILTAHILQRASDPARVLAHLAEVDDIESYLVKAVDEGLSEDDREIMIATAILLGYPGTRDAIETVAERRRIKKLILRLTNQNLLTVQEGEEEEEYTGHAIVRDFYYDVPGRRERREMHRRAAGYYEEEEPPDVLKAAVHYERAREPGRAAGLVTTNFWTLMNQGQVRPLRRLLERFTPRQLDQQQWAEVNLARATIYRFSNQRELAQRSYQEALSTLDTLPDSDTVRKLKARVCQGMGDLVRHRSSSEAMQWLEQGLETVSGSGTEEEITLLLKVSTLDIYAGKYQRALNAIQQSLSLLPPGPSWLRLGAMRNLSWIYWRQGDLVRAIETVKEGLEISENLRDYFQMVTLWNSLGSYKIPTGDWAGVVEAYQQALTLADRLGNVAHQVLLKSNLGFIHLKMGNYKEAMQYLSSSLDLARNNKLHRYEVHILSNLGDLHLRQGHADEAVAKYYDAKSLALKMSASDQLAEIYQGLAQAELALDKDLQKALDYAEQSVTLTQKLGQSLEEGSSLRVLGQVLLANGQPGAALEALAQSLSLLEGKDPYEAARTKHQWGLALISAGDTDEGLRLLKEARATFQQLGAQRDLAAVRELYKENRNED